MQKAMEAWSRATLASVPEAGRSFCVFCVSCWAWKPHFWGGVLTEGCEHGQILGLLLHQVQKCRAVGADRSRVPLLLDAW